jgi:hypothetical protein
MTPWQRLRAKHESNRALEERLLDAGAPATHDQAIDRARNSWFYPAIRNIEDAHRVARSGSAVPFLGAVSEFLIAIFGNPQNLAFSLLTASDLILLAWAIWRISRIAAVYDRFPDFPRVGICFWRSEGGRGSAFYSPVPLDVD